MALIVLTNAFDGQNQCILNTNEFNANTIECISRDEKGVTRIRVGIRRGGMGFSMSPEVEVFHYQVKETPEEVLALIGGETVAPIIDKRIADLEAEIAAWKGSCAGFERQANEYMDRAKKAEAELAALKAQPQEVPPLDPWLVLATAVKALRRLSERIEARYSDARREKMVYDLAADAIEAANSTELTSKPYSIK